MKRSGYEEYCAGLFALQQRVPDPATGEYETALTALVNARYHDATRHFFWLRAAKRQLRIAATALAEIDGIRPSPSDRQVSVWQSWRPLGRWAAVAAAGSALAACGFLLGLSQGPAAPTISPAAVQTATNTNVSSGHVTVSNTAAYNVATYGGNSNDQNASTGDVVVTTNQP